VAGAAATRIRRAREQPARLLRSPSTERTPPDRWQLVQHCSSRPRETTATEQSLTLVPKSLGAHRTPPSRRSAIRGFLLATNPVLSSQLLPKARLPERWSSLSPVSRALQLPHLFLRWLPDQRSNSQQPPSTPTAALSRSLARPLGRALTRLLLL